MEIWSGLILGMIGSLHCAGMCGPIALALPGSRSVKARFLTGRFLYNTGRVFTYMLIGALFGFFGHRILLADFQQQLSVFLGAVIFIAAVISIFRRNKNHYSKIAVRFTSVLKKPLNYFFRKKSLLALFFIGAVNGLLPCGFVYIAAAGSVTTGSILNGMMFMAMFGAGTFPVMLGASVFGGFIREKLSFKNLKILPALSIILALILILRGLNLDIPYLSPQIKSADTREMICK